MRTKAHAPLRVPARAVRGAASFASALAVVAGVLVASALVGVEARAQDAPPSQTWRATHADGRLDRTFTFLQLADDRRELFVAGSDLADLLRVGRFWRPDVRKLVLRVDDQRLTFTVGARSVVGAQRTIMLRTPVAYHHGQAWIPLEFLEAILPELTARTVSIDAENRRIRLGERRTNVAGVDVQKVDDTTELRIRLTEPLAFRVDDSRLHDLVVKVYGGAVDPSAVRIDQPQGLVNAVGARQEDGFALIEVSLSELASRYQSLAEDEGRTILLRVEQAPVTLIPDPVPRGPHLVQTLPPESRGREVNVRRVVIDPGHGGAEVGAVGVGGLTEKTVTLAVARQLERILERREDIEVVLTREDDSFLGLVERTEKANREGADLFISLHANAWADPRARGVETYFLSPAKSKWDAQVARKENTSAAAAEDLDFILWDLVQNLYIQESATLAEAVQTRLAEDLGMVNRGVKQAGFRVLVGAFMPAILVELGFLTNRDDAAKLRDERWQRDAAEALADAIVEFRARMDALRERSR